MRPNCRNAGGYEAEMTKFLCTEPPEVSSGCSSAMQLVLCSRTGTGNTRCWDMQTRFRNGLVTFRLCCLSASVLQGSLCRVRRIYPDKLSIDGAECEAAHGYSENHNLFMQILCVSFPVSLHRNMKPLQTPLCETILAPVWFMGRMIPTCRRST